ncbi:MAG: hypothetical protein WA906_00380 [Pacificimonas sp.]
MAELRYLSGLKASAVALALVAFALPTAALADDDSPRLKPKVERAAPSQLRTGSFTPAGKTATSAQLAEIEKRFNFTPASKAKPKRGVTVGLTSRVVPDGPRSTPTAVTAARVRPTTAPQELGAKRDLGYRGFSISGGVNKERDRFVGTTREGAEVGVAYSARRWRAAVEAQASVPGDGNRILPTQTGEAVSVEVGGAYALGDRLSVRGGVRYDRLHPEAWNRDFVNRDADTARESGTVYLGTSVSF